MRAFEALFDNERINAGIGWILTGAVVLAAIRNVLTNAFLWGGLTLLVAVVIAVPAFVSGDWTLMVPWPLVLVTASALLVRTFDLLPEMTGYVTIVAFALILVGELDAFTGVDMTRRFAVGFATLTAMATQGLWTVAQFYSDRWLGTAFLRSKTELQWDFVIVTVVAIIMGGLLEWYLRQVGHDGFRDRPATRAK